MSASLVGSEMCIRDRKSWCEHTSYTHPRSSPAVRLWYKKRDTSTAGQSCCLLYTSDAADDM
eukprot:5694230-Alexandrium_andersonii.AAC.1